MHPGNGPPGTLSVSSMLSRWNGFYQNIIVGQIYKLVNRFPNSNPKFALFGGKDVGKEKNLEGRVVEFS